ncbi:alpha/beta hydrolase [Mycolicibacterium iranicum]|uniref:BD-FAE-like domain-containing protein n=1 Tax=Mycolicibacterium iranicum TaxID=912594 RepID=A0A178LNQ5_MYCIR|nr:alpha/beta hydrolase [Mycolicibacterium iranicum]OAN33010.1 hypothetical protein A4X20_28080 [Mycolicibacterium iranicum]
MSSHGGSFPGTRQTGEPLYQAPSGIRFTDRDSLEREYDIDRSVRDIDSLLETFEKLTTTARDELSLVAAIHYGPTVDERLDIFPGVPDGPVVIFIHGGYWRSMAAEHFSFVAGGLTASGATVVVTNYGLCPAVTIDEIIRQHRAAIAWTYRNIARYGADPTRIAVVGHSAGGHGIAMLLLTRWMETYGLPNDIIKGACAMSGLFDLRPLPYTSHQEQLRLTADVVLRNSPILTPPLDSPPLLVTYGTDQTSEFKRQSTEFASAWRTAGVPCVTWPRAKVNHFDELLALADADSELTLRVLALTGGHLDANEYLPGRSDEFGDFG